VRGGSVRAPLAAPGGPREDAAVSRPALAMALVLSVIVLRPPPVTAASATCGMVVEDKLVLDRDLRCAGTALVLRNPRTVVQLNGHVLESGRACADGVAIVGIAVEPTADRAQILGPGIVRAFQTGIAVDGAPQVEVRDLRVSDSCAVALAVHDTRATRARTLVLDRNGDGSDAAAAVRVERAARFVLTDSDLFLNDARAGAAVDLRACAGCRLAGNRIVANRGIGIRLDGDSQGDQIERNLVLGQSPSDVVDQGADNLFVLNGFEHGDGVDPPPAWPLLGVPAQPPSGVAGCGTMSAPVKPRATVTITCPQDTGLRAVRNSVVAYRLLNLFDTSRLFGRACDPAAVTSASDNGGGAVTCTNGDSLWPAMLEVTCCLN
jgi:hypothetical protein